MTSPTGPEKRTERARWVAREVLPHEMTVRRWLAKCSVDGEVAGDLIQEAYCRLSLLESVDHIDRPAAYFFSVVRSLYLRRLRRERVVSITAIAEAESVHDEAMSPEAAAVHRDALLRVQQIIAKLPERCRSIVQLRKVEGWSQKQIASHLGTTEKAIEKQVWLGMRMIRQAWSGAEEQGEDRLLRRDRRAGERP